jgi:hypothetical protein
MVTSLSEDRDKRGRSLVNLVCNNCKLEIQATVKTLNQVRLRGGALRCASCKEKKFEVAKAAPLTLTDEQSRRVLKVARRAAFRTIPFHLTHLVDMEDIAQTALLQICIAPGVKIETIEALAFTVVRTLARESCRATQYRPDFIEPKVNAEDGTFPEPFDYVQPLQIEPEEADEIQLAAVASVTPEDQAWLQDHLPNQKGIRRSVADRKRFNRLKHIITAAYRELVAAIEGGADA